MVEPIGADDRNTSPYDRYLMYKQLSTPRDGLSLKPAAQGFLDGSVPASQQTAVPGRIVPPTKAGPGAELAFPTLRDAVLPEDQARKTDPAGSSSLVRDRECQTCKNRRYQDGSDDPGVSYQTPTKISPDQAASAVRSHEYEHVRRSQSQAAAKGREVVSQSVVIKTAICPECGRVYVSGGTTTTVTRAKERAEKFQVGKPAESSGVFLNEKT